MRFEKSVTHRPPAGIVLAAMLLMLVAWLLGCSSPSVYDQYREEPVVECLLVAGEGVEEFKLSRTLPVDSPYDSALAGITGARIVISSDRGDSTVLRPVPGRPGIYESPRYIINVRRRYRLRIILKDRIITSETVCPDTFSLMPLSKTVITYLKDQPVVRWTPSRGAAAYYISITNLERSPQKIERPFADQDPYADRKSRFYWTLGLETVIYPWLHNYYGYHILRVYAIDENFFRYLQTSFQNVREMTEPESSVTNALGYFGSAVLRKTTYILVE